MIATYISHKKDCSPCVLRIETSVVTVPRESVKRNNVFNLNNRQAPTTAVTADQRWPNDENNQTTTTVVLPRLITLTLFPYSSFNLSVCALYSYFTTYQQQSTLSITPYLASYLWVFIACLCQPSVSFDLFFGCTSVRGLPSQQYTNNKQ